MSTSLQSLPRDILYHLLDLCDEDTLSTICRLNKDFGARATPILWRSIDFARWKTRYDNSKMSDRQKRFFAACDSTRLHHPVRWRYLSSCVRVLKCPRLAGIYITQKTGKDFNEFSDLVETHGGSSNIYDVITCLGNLETLVVFVKDFWSTTLHIPINTSQVLKSVSLGGEMGRDVLLSLLSAPENIHDLSLINLIDFPGQDDPPMAVRFLPPIQHRFANLKTLHLCRLGELDAADFETQGLAWEFNGDDERHNLKEWADLLRNVCATLVELTLEIRFAAHCHCFHVTKTFHPGVNEGDDPVEYGARTSQRCREVLLPVLKDTSWPRLTRLTFVGMDMFRTAREREDFCEGMGSQISIECRDGGVVNIENFSTPISFSPPVEIFADSPR